MKIFGKSPLELTDNRIIMRIGSFLTEIAFKLSRFPIIERLHPWTKAETTDMRWLPINEGIHAAKGAPLPLELLNRFIEEASNRFIIDYCGCRRASSCSKYPEATGCLIMGEVAGEAAKTISRKVTEEEAKAHASSAVEAGLVPAVGTAAVDRVIMNIENPSQMLIVCFCCECCCLGRYLKHIPLKNLNEIFAPLEGVSMTVKDSCDGCGTCIEACYMDAIEIKNGKAVKSDYCRVCGRCAMRCPKDAIVMTAERSDYLEKAYERIMSRVSHM